MSNNQISQEVMTPRGVTAWNWVKSRVGRIMLNFSPIMLFQYAQNSTDYALNYASNLPIMLKLCPLFLEETNLRSNN